MVVSVVRRGLGVREILVYRLHVFTFLMVSASFRDCWKSKEMLLFCLVMEKSRNPDEKSSFIYSVGLGQCMLGRKSDDFTDEFETAPWEKPGDPHWCLITCIDPSDILL